MGSSIKYKNPHFIFHLISFFLSSFKRFTQRNHRMNIALQFLVLAAVAIANVMSDWTPPAFCRSSDCPKFTIVDKKEGFELRRYEASRWASTSVQNRHDLKDAMRTGFWRLFNYIRGNNEGGQKIAMTVPVRTKIVPGDEVDTFTVSFMVPFSVEVTPRPLDPNVFLEQDPESEQYVSHFGGYASNDDWQKCIDDLMTAVGDQPHQTGFHFIAGYNSPFQFWNRHNECWLPK